MKKLIIVLITSLACGLASSGTTNELQQTVVYMAKCQAVYNQLQDMNETTLGVMASMGDDTDQKLFDALTGLNDVLVENQTTFDAYFNKYVVKSGKEFGIEESALRENKDTLYKNGILILQQGYHETKTVKQKRDFTSQLFKVGIMCSKWMKKVDPAPL